MTTIGYLDLPCGLTGEMLLACLVDAGWAAERLRGVIAEFIPPDVRWLFAVEEVMKGPLRATAVDLFVDDERFAESLETAATVHAAAIGLHEMAIDRLYASADPAADWPSHVVAEPTWDAAAVAVLKEFAQFTQPEFRLDRIGIGADQRDRPWPNVARLWLGTSADPVKDASTR